MRRTTFVAGVVVGNPLDEAAAKLAADIGIAWIRTDISFQPAFRGTYSAADKYGISIIGILDYATLDYNSSATLGDWKSAVSKAQTTFSAIHVWEVWNEPTMPQYRLGYMDGTPQHYFDLIKEAYTTLKARDPRCTVLGLGGAQIGYGKELEFAKAVFSLGGGAYMDAISIHAYPSNLNQGVTWEYYTQAWTQELQEYGALGKAIWVTETGLTSDQLTEADQADYLKNSYSFFKERGVGAFIYFQLKDFNGSNGSTQMWGLLHIDMTPKPSYVQYGSLLKGKT
jgi:hypothetical protein